jgi:excisionase family DNA binding protein
LLFIVTQVNITEITEMAQPLSEDLLPGAKSAAKFVGVTPRAIYHMVYAGHLPAIRVGKRLYFRRSELERAFTSDA